VYRGGLSGKKGVGKMAEQIQWKTIDQIFCKSMRCRKCFDQQLAEPALIDVAQPRLIGSHYFGAPVKILIITPYPGCGTSEKQKPNIEFCKILHDYRDGKNTTLQDLFAFQSKYIKKWGEPQGHFVDFYICGLELDIEEIAFTTIAWCATRWNKHPPEMLSKCFSINTGKLIQATNPNIIILSGSDTHKYSSDISCNNIVRAKNYAYYEKTHDHDAEQKELLRIRREITRLVKKN
jgi:hypothetical protein